MKQLSARLVNNIEVDELIETEHFNGGGIPPKLLEINKYLKNLQKTQFGNMGRELERIKAKNDDRIEQEYDRYLRLTEFQPAGNQLPRLAIPLGIIGQVLHEDDRIYESQPRRISLRRIQQEGSGNQQQKPAQQVRQPPQIRQYSQAPLAPQVRLPQDSGQQIDEKTQPVLITFLVFDLFDPNAQEELNNDFGRIDTKLIILFLDGFTVDDGPTKIDMKSDELIYSVDKKRFKPLYIINMKDFMMEFIDRLKLESEPLANDMEKIYEDYKLPTSECHSLSVFSGHRHKNPLECFDIYATVMKTTDGYKVFRQMIYVQSGASSLSPAVFLADLITEKLYTKPSTESFIQPDSFHRCTTSQIISLQSDQQKRLTIVLESFGPSREKKRISILRTAADPSMQLRYELPFYTDGDVPAIVDELGKFGITLLNSFETKSKDTCKYFLNKKWILSSSSNKLIVTITYNRIGESGTVESYRQMVDWQRVATDKDAVVEHIFFEQEYAETNNNIVKDEPVCYFGLVTNRKNVVIFKADVDSLGQKIDCSTVCTTKIEISLVNRVFKLHGIHFDVKKQILIAFTTFDADKIEPLEEVYRYSDMQDFAVPIIEEEDMKEFIPQPIHNSVLFMAGFYMEKKKDAQVEQYSMKPTARLAVPISYSRNGPPPGKLQAILKQDYSRNIGKAEKNAKPSDWLWVGIENSFELFQVEIKNTEKVSARVMFEDSDEEKEGDQQVDIYLGPKAYRTPIPIKIIKSINRVALVDQNLLKEMIASNEKHKKEEKKRRDKLEKNPEIKLTEAEKQQLSKREYELKALGMWNAAKENNPIGDIMVADEYYRMVFIENAGPYEGSTTIEDTTTNTGVDDKAPEVELDN